MEPVGVCWRRPSEVKHYVVVRTHGEKKLLMDEVRETSKTNMRRNGGVNEFVEKKSVGFQESERRDRYGNEWRKILYEDDSPSMCRSLDQKMVLKRAVEKMEKSRKSFWTVRTMKGVHAISDF